MGDSVNDAVYPGATAGAFNSNDVLPQNRHRYRRCHVPGFCLQHRFRRAIPWWCLADVGAGRGHYQRISSAANRHRGLSVAWRRWAVFYRATTEPVVQLVAPKTKCSLGFSHSLPDNTHRQKAIHTKTTLTRSATKQRATTRSQCCPVRQVRNVTHAPPGTLRRKT